MVDEDKWLEITSLTNLRKTATSSTSAVMGEIGGDGKENEEKMGIADSKTLDFESENSSSSSWKRKPSSSGMISSSPACWPFVTPYDNLQLQPTTCLSSNNKIPVDKRQRKKYNPPNNVLLYPDFNEKIVCEKPVNDIKKLNHQLCVRNPSNHNNTNKHSSSSSSSSSNVNRGHLKLSEPPANSIRDENSTKKSQHVGDGDCLKNNDKNDKHIDANTNIMDTVQNMKSRLIKLTTVLAEKIQKIEQQEITIGNLHQKLVPQTTESLSWDFDHSDMSEVDCDSEDDSIHEEIETTPTNNDDNGTNNDNNNHTCVQHGIYSCSLQEDAITDKNMEVQKVSTLKKVETGNVGVYDDECSQEKMDKVQQTHKYDNNYNHNNGHEMNKDDKSNIKGCAHCHCKNRKRMTKKNMMMMKKMEKGTTKTKIYPLLLEDRIDTLARKMDHLELELPKRIQAICAEFIQKLLGCHSLMQHFNSNIVNNTCPCKACREIAAMTVEDEKEEDNVEFCTIRTTPSQKKKLNPMVSIMRKLCDKTQSLSNPPPPPPPLLLPSQNPLKWNKSPIIKPKTNLSANYRFLHHLNHHQQQRDSQSHQQGLNSTVKVKKIPHNIEKSEDMIHSNTTHHVDNNILDGNNGFDFQAVEEKLCNIENVVDKFKHYLISLLLNRF